MKRALILFNFIALVVLWMTTPLYAKENCVVVLNFSDNTSYGYLESGKILDQLVLDKLIDNENIIVYERSIIKESIDAESEVSFTKEKVDVAVKNNDFNDIFIASKNDIDFKKQGDCLSNKRIQEIGTKYCVTHLIYGTVDYIGGEEKEKNLDWGKDTYGHLSKSIKTYVTLLLIETATGKIVWQKRECGIAKDSYDSLNKMAYGTKKFSNRLYYEALDDIAVKLTDALNNDLKNNDLIL